MRLRFEHDLKRLERDLGKLGPCVIERAAPAAVNRVTKTVQSVAVKAVSGATSIKQKEVRPEIRVKLARRDELGAYVDATTGRAKNLAGFVSESQRKPSGGEGQPQFFRKRARNKSKKYLRPGVKAKAWGKTKVYGGSFIGRGRSGNVLVLSRTGPGRRAKLKALRGPSIRQEFLRKPVQEAMSQKASQRFPIEMDRAIRISLKRCQL